MAFKAITSSSSYIILIFILILNIVHVLSENSDDDNRNPQLVIYPAGPKVVKAAHNTLALTCKINNVNPNLISDLIWINPNGLSVPQPGDTNIQLNKIPGSLILIFANPSSEDSGNYTCKGRFQNTKDIKAEVDITFYKDVTWDDCPPVQSFIRGDEKQLIRCQVSGTPPPIITWLKDGQDVNLDQYSYDRRGLYITDPVNDRHVGQYTIRTLVTETGELKNKFITVEVHVKPEIKVISPQLDGIEGESVMLTCKAEGIPSPLYTWLDPGRRNLSQDSGYTVDRNNGVLNILKVRKNEDRGNFTCIAENPAGRSEGVTKLYVITKPVVTSFQNITEPEGKDANFECRATGEPTPKMLIRKDGQEPFSQADGRVIITQRTEGEETVLNVKIYDIKRKDDGLYYCSSENSGGNAEKVGHLLVQFKPDLSSNPREFLTWGDRPKNLTCIAEAVPNATIIWHHNNRRIEENDPSFKVFDIGNGYSNLLVQRSSANLYGFYRCEATNTLGTALHDFELKQAYKPQTLNQISVSDIHPTSIAFKLYGPSDTGGLAIKKYWVEYLETPYGLINWEFSTKIDWPAQQGEVYVVDGLKPKTSYTFRFAGENDVGIGEWTREETKITSSESEPEAPAFDGLDIENGIRKSMYPDTYLVKWSEPVDNGQKIDSYEIKYHTIKNQDDTERTGAVNEAVVGSNELSYKLVDLVPNSFYMIELRAKNSIGLSKASTLIFKTEEGGSEYDGATAKFVGQSSSIGLVIGIIILALIALLVIMDITFYFRFNVGALYFIINHSCRAESNVSHSKNNRPEDEKRRLPSNSRNNGTHVRGSFDDMSRSEMDNPAFDCTADMNCEELTPMMMNGSQGNKGDGIQHAFPKDSAV